MKVIIISGKSTEVVTILKNLKKQYKTLKDLKKVKGE